MQNEIAVDREDEAKSASEQSFGDILNQFEQQHQAPQKGEAAREGIVVAVTAENIILDIGMKQDGMLPLESARDEAGQIPVKAGYGDLHLVTGLDGNLACFVAR